MKPDHKVILVVILIPVSLAALGLLAVLTALILPRFINTQKPFIDKAEIIEFTQPLRAEAGPGAKKPDTTQEYHLWLKLELSPAEFAALFRDSKNEPAKDAPIKKDEMKTERLATASVIQDMLVVKGYSNAGVKTDIGFPLSITKYITLAKENLRPLENEDSLANPQGVPRQKFQPQTDIYQDSAGAKTLLYIHLESGIKPLNTANLLSLTLTYLKDNKATQSQTLPLFSY